MYFGHGVYGVEAASRLYFGKSAKDLTLEEAALIAGILQGNVRQSPYVNMDAALRRRNYTLGRMAEVGFITAAEAEAARKKPIVTARRAAGAAVGRAVLPRGGAQGARSRYGAKQLYENGLSIQTRSTCSCRKPPTARSTTGCGGSTSGAGSASRAATSSPKGTRSTRSSTPRWDRPMAAGDIVPAVVTARRRRGDRSCAPARCTSRSTRKGYAWTRQDAADAARDARRSRSKRELVDRRRRRRRPRPARSSSRRPSRARCSRSTTAPARSTRWSAATASSAASSTARRRRYRQVGSAFKPIVYTAAIDRGYTPVDAS